MHMLTLTAEEPKNCQLYQKVFVNGCNHESAHENPWFRKTTHMSVMPEIIY